MGLARIEVVEDRTPQSRCDEGFLTLRRLLVRNHYEDGTSSAPYPCDLVRRPGSDAVVAVLYERTSDGRVEVLLRESSRVPIYLRKDDHFVHPDPREYLSILEVVAGMVEPDDPPGAAGRARRGAIEALEEVGLAIDETDLVPLGGETFASPGTSDEKLYFVAGEACLSDAGGGDGDGSGMEEWSVLHRFDLADAIRRCREGQVPDMKTEVALLRLADALGYLPQLGCFADALPESLAARHDALGAGGEAEQ
jgi:ADP-ribose pyrophosphatase